MQSYRTVVGGTPVEEKRHLDRISEKFLQKVGEEIAKEQDRKVLGEYLDSVSEQCSETGLDLTSVF